MSEQDVNDSCLDKHGRFVMQNGRHTGKPITRVPVGYLFWMVREKHTHMNYALQEIQRRGSQLPDMEISGHAIDRASTYCLGVWQKTRLDDKEGLHSWLLRVSGAALINGKKGGDGIYYLGIRFVFDYIGDWPILKTVIFKGGQRGGA